MSKQDIAPLAMALEGMHEEYGMQYIAEILERHAPNQLAEYHRLNNAIDAASARPKVDGAFRKAANEMENFLKKHWPRQ